ncbi:hypothetical protein H7J07_04645 [Mycobacterium koreense]|uniref:Uncharacterized protein n=1 Tax=Mycolicibacillus koreensis TaxID=1069220 RepID=A0A7I7SAK3_9MYCO|nr:hypothetical protein [Mycolicibacillus koreensis]MCV7247545.1 hypothetical protein [Mycolicibacillus koreensis]OSC34604.1 hypothetical protein B8W67_06440 [Mycolicibacillus koreensis]BBY53924.1 hypothetical protein MKOR_11750 [Mycolicibacillus koreensis]
MVPAAVTGHLPSTERLAAQIIVAAEGDGTLVERTAEVLPWVRALSPQDQVACAQQLLDAARTSRSSGPLRLVDALIMWRATAAAIAEGLDQDDLDWLDVPTPVERP